MTYLSCYTIIKIVKMASKARKAVAKLVTENRQPCVFCCRDVDDEVIYGKLYSILDIQCHYFCVLLSCCLVQKGRDTEGLFGFLYKDILAEVERSKKHKCSYCGRGGASLGCSVAQCRKQFHLPCGREKNVVSLFYGNYKSFCELHAPKQKISQSVMVQAKARMKRDRLLKAGKIDKDDKQTEDPEMVCVICYEEVPGYPTTQTFWPPCCGRDKWLHRSCLQRMALSAGMHYLKCPLCNDKDNFHNAVCAQGYYLPDRDAAWELEQNAFSEIYAREATCAAVDCKCPFGRTHDELGIWDIKLCLLCGSWGMHAHCSGLSRAVCAVCSPAAQDIEQLETRLTEVILAEQAQEQRNARSGPIMPSRMSLRRTKGRVQAHSSTSSTQNMPRNDIQNNTELTLTELEHGNRTLRSKNSSKVSSENIPTNEENQNQTKLDLKDDPDLKPRLKLPPHLDATLLSPVKLLERTAREKGGDVVLTKEVIDRIRLKFSKPKPMSAKKKIVNEILDDLFKNVFKDTLKNKDPVIEWNSPKKCSDITNINYEDSKDNTTPMNMDTLKTEVIMKDLENSDSVQEIDNGSPEKCSRVYSENVNEDNTEENSVVDKGTKENDSNDEENDNLNVKGTVDQNNDITVNNNDISTENKHVAAENNEKAQNNDIITENNDKVAEDVDAKDNQSLKQESDAIAEDADTLPIIDTPKKLKTVDIQQDSSMEISENDEVVNIDVMQIENAKEKEIKKYAAKTDKSRCSFKFSPVNKNTLVESDFDMDIETFKDKYLNDGDRDYRTNKQLNNETPTLSDVTNTNRKRKLEMREVANKKRKRNKNKRKKKQELKIKFKSTGKSAQKRKELKTLKMKNRRITLQIKIKDSKSRAGKLKSKIIKKKQKVKTFKQYVLKYSPVQTDKIIAKPETDVAPMKRKYTKNEKSTDNLVQTSIQSFFKAK